VSRKRRAACYLRAEKGTTDKTGDGTAIKHTPEFTKPLPRAGAASTAPASTAPESPAESGASPTPYSVPQYACEPLKKKSNNDYSSI